MRKLAIPALLILTLSSALAQEKITVESSLNAALDLICPQGSILTCPVLDFLTAFGVVFSVLYLCLSLIPQLTSAESKNAFSAFAVIAAFATAFYVYSTKLPFVSFVAPATLLIAGLILALSIINAVRTFSGAEAGHFSWKGILAIIGFMLFAIGMILVTVREIGEAYTEAPLIGTYMMIGGFVILIISLITWLAGGLNLIPAGGGGGAGRLGHIPVPEEPEARQPPEAVPIAEGIAPEGGAPGATAPPAVAAARTSNARRIKSDLRKGLFDLYKLIKKVKETDADLLKLYNLITFLGNKRGDRITSNKESKKKGFFAHIGEATPRKDFNEKFNKEANNVIGILGNDIQIIKNAIGFIKDAITRCPKSAFRNRLEMVLKYAISIDKEFEVARSELEILTAEFSSQSLKYYDNRENINKSLRNALSAKNKGLRGVLYSLDMLIKNLRYLTKV